MNLEIGAFATDLQDAIVSRQAQARDREWDAFKCKLRLSHSAEDTRFTKDQRTKHGLIVQDGRTPA